MATTLIRNARIVDPGQGVFGGFVLFSERGILEVNPREPARDEGLVVIDGQQNLLTPGLIDLHTHGLARYRYDAAPDHLVEASSLSARFGTTTVFPTLGPVPGPGMLDGLAKLSAALEKLPVPCMPGLHLEGPFTALPGAGCATVPGDVGMLEELLAACSGRMAIMSVSPETPNILPVIERLVGAGVIPFVTHTMADAPQTQAAIDAGARHATHFYDVFPQPPEKDPGVRPVGAVEAFLVDPRTTVDFICDGCHVDPLAVRLALAAKGFRGVVLITDSNIGAGLPSGLYDTSRGYAIQVRPGDGARIAGDHPLSGALAGSALTMNVGMANLLRWLDRPPEETWALGTLNPASVMRMSGKGRIEVGADADLVLWNADLTPLRTWVAGRLVYEWEPEDD